MSELKQRLKRVLVLLTAGFALVCPIEAQVQPDTAPHPAQEEDPAVRAEVLRLIKQLGSPVFNKREDALSQLQKMGTKAVPTIRGILPDLSLDARMQLEGMLDDLTPAAKSHVVKFEASMISTKAGETTVGEVLRQLTAEAGFRFLERSGVDEKMTFHLEGGRREALKVLTDMCTKTGMRWAQDYNNGCYRFYRGAAGSTPIEVYDGPFRVALNSMTVNTNLQFGTEPTNNCYIRGQFDIEPTADIVGVIFQPEVVVATDDKKRDIKVKDTTTTSYQSAVNRRNFNFNMRIDLPSKDARKITDLHVKIPVVVPTRIESATVQLDTKDPKHTAISGTLEVKFHQIEKQGKRRYVVLHVTRKLPKSKTTRPVEITDQNIYFIAADGAEERSFGRVVRQVLKDHERLRIEMPDGEFTALSFAQVTEVENRVLEFKFKDIPLP